MSTMAAPRYLKYAVWQAGVTFAASLTRQVKLGDVNYFLPPTAAWSIENFSPDGFGGADDLFPLTVVTLNDTYTSDAVAGLLDSYGEKDDVWSSSFTDVVYIQLSEDESEDDVEDLTQNLAGQYDISRVLTSAGDTVANQTVADGPYFLHRYTGNVYKAYRLYNDYSQAFVASSYQDPCGTHHTMPAAIDSDAGLTIAVPSRLYFTPTKDEPLAGVRISVKDLFDLRGLKTGGGNKALYNMGSPKTENAVAVQKLIDAGAVIVGKNKLSEFAISGPEVTEHIDYLLPVNPRGDGYNLPSDSSGGSASAISSYDWLDASLASDTGGSIRAPAYVCGVHGNRPTQDLISMDGALPLSTTLDTAGIIARDPVLWSKVNKALFAGTVEEYREYPQSIFIDPSTVSEIERYESDQPEIAAKMKEFLAALEDISSGSVTNFSTQDVWDEAGPANFPAAGLGSVLRGVYRNITAYEQWTEFGEEYSETYKSANNGDFPHVNPLVRTRWFRARDVYNEDIYKQDLAYRKQISDWAVKNFLKPDETTCSNGLFVYFLIPEFVYAYKPDVSFNGLNPFILDILNNQFNTQIELLTLNVTLQCNTTSGTEESCASAESALEDTTSVPGDGVASSQLTSIVGYPDFALTLGSFDLGESTTSNSTMQTQALPLAVDIVAAKGCDFMLFNLVEELHERGVVKNVRTGALV